MKLFTVSTPTSKKDLQALMLEHARDLEEQGHHELAKSARVNALDSPSGNGKQTPERRTALAKIENNTRAQNTNPSATKKVQTPGAAGLHAWLAENPFSGSAGQPVLAADEYYSSPSPAPNEYKLGGGDSDIDDPVVRHQLAALRDGVLRFLSGQPTPGLEREVVAPPPRRPSSAFDELWRGFEDADVSPAASEPAELSLRTSRAHDALWARWEGGTAAEELPPPVSRPQLRGALLLALLVAAAALGVALLLHPAAPAAPAPHAAPAPGPLSAVQACAAHARGAGAAVAAVRCVGVDAVRAVLSLLRQLGRATRQLFKRPARKLAHRPAQPLEVSSLPLGL